MAATGFSLGCNGRGAQASSIDRPVSLTEPPLEEQFRLVAESGAFDHFDRLPLPGQLDEYRRLVERYGLPVRTASWFYALGQDEPLISQNLRIAREIGAAMHNMMIFTRHAAGHVVTDDELVDCYLRTFDEGMKLGVEPAFELHVNMWSEDFRRVTPVAEAVMKRGVPFNFTLDYSHGIFKIGNPEEQDISGVRADVEAGRLILDPFEPGNLVEEWLGMGIVRWLQVRAAAPNGPRNIWSRREPGQKLAGLPDDPDQAHQPGRGIMYPFAKPAPGEWHSPWHAYLLEPTKEVVRKALRHHRDSPDSRLDFVTTEMINLPDYGHNARRHHRDSPDSRLDFVTTEMINLPDYGHNARFSLIGQNAAIARWVRQCWDAIRAEPPRPA